MKSQTPTRRNNQIDPTFGKGGRLAIAFPKHGTNVCALTMNVTGVIFAYGMYWKLDRSFDTARHHKPTPSLSPPPAQHISASSHQESIPHTLVACRLTREGQFDRAFGENGFVTAPDRALFLRRFFYFLSNGNDFVFTGTSNFFYALPDLPLAHFTLSGEYIDTVRLNPFTNEGNGLLPVEEDKVLACYASTIGQIMYRFNADGSPDESFGDAGWVNYLPKPDTSGISHLARGLGTSAQTVYVSGSLNDAPCVVRLKLSGERDNKFGKNGLYVLNNSILDYGEANKILPLTDGGALVHISGFTHTGAQGLVIKLTAAGQLDSTFNNGTPLEIPKGYSEDMALQADGTFLVSQVPPADENGEFTTANIFRYLANGHLDTRFGDNGVVTFENDEYFLHGTKLYIFVQPDGKIILSGEGVTLEEGTILVRLMA